MANPLDKTLQAGANTLQQTTQGPTGSDLRALKNATQQNLIGFSQPQFSVGANRSAVLRPTAAPTTPAPVTAAPGSTTPAAAQPSPTTGSVGSGANRSSALDDRVSANTNPDLSGVRAVTKAPTGISLGIQRAAGVAVPGAGALGIGVNALLDGGATGIVGGPTNPSVLNTANRAALARRQEQVLAEAAAKKAAAPPTPPTTTLGKIANRLGADNIGARTTPPTPSGGPRRGKAGPAPTAPDSKAKDRDQSKNRDRDMDSKPGGRGGV